MTADHTRYEDALSAWEVAQEAVELARTDGTAGHLDRASAYQVRGFAYELLSQTAPMSTHISVVHAYLAAAMTDAKTADDCILLATEAGEDVPNDHR